MKKFIILLTTIILLCGCGKNSKENIINNFSKSVDNVKSYKLTGTMKIFNDEDTFSYTLEASYLKDNFYKVVLLNETNNHKQIILRNNDGVYVITPSLNKSFKFDSVWPENSSQSYLLKSLKTDVTKDSAAEYGDTEDGYFIKSTVNYPNNTELKYQKIYFDKDSQIKKVEVYNEENQIKIEVIFTDVNMNAKLKEDEFLLDNYIDSETNSSCKEDECDKTTSKTDEIVYPLYVPTNTYLTGKDNVNSEESDRVILTFTGDKNFVLVEQSSSVDSVFEIIPVYGDPLMISDTVGALGTNSISWTTGGRDYYIVSNDLTTDELVNVAASINNTSTVSASK